MHRDIIGDATRVAIDATSVANRLSSMGRMMMRRPGVDVTAA
jgi:hypothetical protein